MRIIVGSDHAGFELKEHFKGYLERSGHDVVDVGTTSEESVDYPDYARAVGEAVAAGDAELGILACGSGLGMAIAANKVDGVRAVQVMDPELATMARMHNDANVLTLPGRYMTTEQADAVIDAFLGATFEGGRHQKRVDKITKIENGNHG
ncbi:MAG: ribose 5-phosphate isomerase B [Coriobacteriia bacterium]